MISVLDEASGPGPGGGAIAAPEKLSPEGQRYCVARWEELVGAGRLRPGYFEMRCWAALVFARDGVRWADRMLRQIEKARRRGDSAALAARSARVQGIRSAARKSMLQMARHLGLSEGDL